ncbi:LD-carboxypeptidase [uncultured Thermosynechococcus sp.]|uniref:S66 peptidase family protein n=1 Tax=uncultured Thermosynechococcus sp. TaxID=436945 RepID=UPI0026333776|nr:LD-carboxypeptidase [uncultured Thermosynechococcus sp.]
MTALAALPPPLQPGDRLAVAFPSGALREPERFWQGVACWRAQGYEVVVDEAAFAAWGYLAGSDQQRRDRLWRLLQDDSIKGILCGRGGFGATRLLERWQWPMGSPKWLIGFSDITALLWSYAAQGVAGVHGPVLTTLAEEPLWSQQRLFDLVQGKPLEPLFGRGWGGGTVQGRLLVGNLTVATHLLATPDCPPLENVILALEDVGEAPYRIDRMLTQWRRSGALNQVKGIALGRFSGCEDPTTQPNFRVVEVLGDRLGDLGIPIVSDLPFGHAGVNAALPVGVATELDGDRGSLHVLL